MAVARCELGVAEIDWVVAMCEGREPQPMSEKERGRIMREIKRAQRAAHESLAREQANTRRMKAGFRTAPGKDTETLILNPGARMTCKCPGGPLADDGLHAVGCPRRKVT